MFKNMKFRPNICAIFLLQLVYGLHVIFITRNYYFYLFTDSDIRLCVLNSLDDRFDDHLAQAENLSALFVALNDEVFEIREMSICMIGRLSSKNPAYVMPSLRKTLIQVSVSLRAFIQ